MVDFAQDIELVLIRHGQTPANAEGRYTGCVLDQPLSEAGRAQAAAAGPYPEVTRVYVSFMRRARQTASLMFPNAEQIVVDGIQEMNFGAFTGHTEAELADDPAYRAWKESKCLLPCPEGESQEQVTDRICTAIERLLREANARGEERVIVVVHGGTMMSLLWRLADERREYWQWLLGNCQGYHLGVSLAGEVPVIHVRGVLSGLGI